MYEVIFKNDNNVLIKLIKHKFSEVFKTRDNREVYFRKIHSYLIKNKIINGNIIDLGAWIGDLPVLQINDWKDLNIKLIIYS